jgi:catechol 2,3-dioxygenase-like lactoylglutathione lyase family enzyme
VLESASTHVMIAVKDLDRAKEFYSATLGLTATDEQSGAVIRYETRAGSWFLGLQICVCRHGEEHSYEVRG